MMDWSKGLDDFAMLHTNWFCMRLSIPLLFLFYSVTVSQNSKKVNHITFHQELPGSNCLNNICISRVNVCQLMTGWVDLMFYEARMLRSQIRCHFVSSCLSISQVIHISCSRNIAGNIKKCITGRGNEDRHTFKIFKYALLILSFLFILWFFLKNLICYWGRSNNVNCLVFLRHTV